MRDAELAKKFPELSLKLEMYFSIKIKKSIRKPDKALLVDDLVQLTAMETLEYCRNPDYDSYPIEALIILKAEKIWKRYRVPPKRRITSESLSEAEQVVSDTPNPHRTMVMEETVEIIREMSDDKTWLALTRRDQGFEDFEIAIEIGVKQDNLRQKICRLRAKIQEKNKDLEFF